MVFVHYHCNRPFAASHLRGTKLLRWRAKVALGGDKPKAYIMLNGNFLITLFVLSQCDFGLQHSGFLPRECLHNVKW